MQIIFNRSLACCQDKTVWPSGLRRWLQAPVRKGVGSNPTAVIRFRVPSITYEWVLSSPTTTEPLVAPQLPLPPTLPHTPSSTYKEVSSSATTIEQLAFPQLARPLSSSLGQLMSCCLAAPCQADAGKAKDDPGRTRTCNLWFRRPTPYPLGHRAKWF